MKKLLVIVSLFALTTGSAFAAKAPKAFTEMDANSDGKIDASEWVASTKTKAEAAGKKFNEKSAIKNMAKRDTNGDKVVTVEEFVSSMKSKDSSDKKKDQ